MSNCLFEAAYERILQDCNCTPSFHQLAYKEVPDICRGPGLTCMNKILRFIGKLNKVTSRAIITVYAMPGTSLLHVSNTSVYVAYATFVLN